MAITKPRPSSDDRIRAALWFAERGFGVFSVWSTDDHGVCHCSKGSGCENPGKHPIPSKGFRDATTDEKRIRTMLSAASEPNFGLLPPDGVFVLDVDGDGVARLAELETLHGPLPPTLRTVTAHGQHVFLRWPADLPRPIGQLWGYVTRWGTGANAGYVIGPRSVHASGAEYAPAGSAFAIAELPDTWARSVVGRPTDAPFIQVGGSGYVLPDRIAAGESRYGAILAYTAHLYNTSRLEPDDMWLLVRDKLAPRFADGLPEADLRARFDRAVDKMAARLGDRRGGPAAPPEPIDPSSFPIPENRGAAMLSDLGDVEYVEDLIRPGRIVVWAAEEGSGKSYTVSGELGIRVATTGGDFAGTWPVLRTGRVLVMSEMHPDDDFVREDVVLHSLGLERRALDDRYYRLDLMTAAGGRPALTVPEWRSWVMAWIRDHGVLLLVIDTATGATQVDPWGREIQAVYTALRVMLADDPELAVVLVVHLKKPQGKGEDRGISDVLGEWGRWCDVVVLQENDGLSLERTKITTRKRVRRQRRIVATKSGGLLIDALDLEGGLAGAKIPPHDILAAIRDNPDSSITQLAKILEISPDTMTRYAASLGAAVVVSPGPRRSRLVRLADSGATSAEDRTTPHVLVRQSQSDGRRDAARTPPSKEGEGVAVRQSQSDDLGARQPEAALIEAAIPGGPSPTVTCHFPHDHSTAWQRSADDHWYCSICSPEGAS
jgi:hypothetical protein